MDKTITYGHLRTVLGSLGYMPNDLGSDHVVYRNPGRRLFITLPRMDSHDQVRPIDLLRVQKALANEGVVEESDFDSLFLINKGDRLLWREPTTGREIKVTAVAGERDGLVIIKQNGAIMPCPADQLRKEEDVASAAP